MVFEIIISIIVFFLFVFVKENIDGLKEEIDGLRMRLEAKSLPGTIKEPAAQIVNEQEKPEAFAEAIVAATKTESAMVSENPVADNENLEFKVGGKIFTGVGVVAIIFAIGFFLRYAFENGLIDEFGRIVLGVVAGLILLAIGEVTRKRFPNYGQVLTGGGLGVLYLSFYAAFSLYGLMAQPAAFFAMILVTASGILLSLRQNSMALAMFAQLGGFLTPLLLNNGSNSPHVLFLYIMLLDLAVLMLSFYKLWQKLMVVSFVGTILAYLSWFGSFYNSSQFAVAEGYLSLFFAIFLFIPFIQYFIKKSSENSWDLALTSFNPIFYFVMSYAIINPLYPDLMGLFVIAIGTLYCALSLIVGGEDERASLFRHFLLSAGFILLAIAVPIQFHQKWIVIGWAAEALAFTAVGFKMKFQFYRILGQCLFFATILRLLFSESELAADAMPILNIRLLTYILVFAMLVAAAYVYRIRKGELSNDERPLFSLLAMEGAFIGLAGFSFEINDFFSGYWYPILWTAGGLIAGLLSFRLGSKALRVVTYMTFTAAAYHLLFIDSAVELSKYIPVFNTRVFAFVASALIIRAFLFLLRRKKDQLSSDEYGFFQPALFLCFHFLLFWVMSAEIISYCDKQALLNAISSAADSSNLENVLLSIAWTIYGAVLLVTGIIKKATYERFLAMALFIIVIIKVFLIDTANLDNLYRFYSFITLGGILLLAGYLYYRYQDRIRKFVKGE